MDGELALDLDLPADAAPHSEAPDRANDRALVADVLAQAPGAFARLVKQYQGLCFHIINRMVRQPDDTRELCQDTFLRVHRYLHQYRGDSSLQGWIGQVAYSVAKRHLERKRIPLQEAADADAHQALLENVSDEFDLAGAVVDDESARCLHEAIETLPPLQRTLLTLYHLEELPIGEIAEMTGLAEGTIKSHLFRSRQRLRQVLEARMGVAA